MRTTGLVLLGLGLTIGIGAPLRADGPSATTAPSSAPQLSERQASILMQLANAEANIKAINKALKLTGYKVGLAYDQVEGSEKANELMDRKGGAPVPWDQFYGKTAMSFYHHSSAELHYNAGRGAKTIDAQWEGSRLTKVDRPKEFNFIYRANDQQASRAKEQIASLERDQAGLLARRQKHEADQSYLWAALAWERIEDREIAHQPLYRFQLGPKGPRAELLRGPVLFLRTADKAVADALETVQTDQAGTFADLHHRTKDAYAALLDTLSNALVANGVTDDDRKEADTLKSLCKQVAEQCVVTDDNYKLALDSDRAKEDSSKLEYRGQLQSSLAKLAAMMEGLDGRIQAVASVWAVKPEIGTESPDRVPAFTSHASRTPVAVAPPPPQPVASTPERPAPLVPLQGEGQWVDLFNGRDLSGWSAKGSGSWSVRNGMIVSSGGTSALVTHRDDYGNVRIRVEAMINRGGNSGVFFRCQGGAGVEFSRYEAQIASPEADKNRTGSIYLYDISRKKPSSVAVSFADTLVPAGQWMTMEITCEGPHIIVTVDGHTTADFEDSHFGRGAIGLQQHDAKTEVRVRKVQVMELGR
jgi:hypothetical protein